MARVKVCPRCSHPNPPSELFCRCRYPLTNVPLTTDAPVPDPEPAGDPDSRADSRGQNRPRRGTQGENAGDAASATLIFGQREIAVLSGSSVPIGRDPDFSPHAEWIADNPYVSRRHAEVFMKDGLLYVRHLSTTNPTYHNETPLTDPDATARLSDEDRVGFSRYLVATVRLG